MYGTLLKSGGPNSLRASDKDFNPPSSTVPPSGTATVVEIVMLAKVGVCTNCVNSTGWPDWLPSIEVKIGTTIGNVAIDPPGPGSRLVIVGVSDMRTYRRSADTTAWMVSDVELNGFDVIDGRMANCPPVNCASVTPVTRFCELITLIVEVWPLNSVSFGACMTFVRVSPWAASMKRNTWMSLRNARPMVRPLALYPPKLGI